MNGNHSRSRQTHNPDIINILLTSSFRSVPSVSDPRFFPYDLEIPLPRKMEFDVINTFYPTSTA